MNKLHQQIKHLDNVIKRHEKFSHFSGIACIITGALWLLNEGGHMHFQLTDNYRVISWIVVALVSIIVATYLTIYEGHKQGKEIINLSLLSIMDKLIVVAFSTLALMWVFYDNSLITEIPSLLMVMYGILILTSKQNITTAIRYFGYLNLLAGIISLVFINYSILLSAIMLGGGHIILGIYLIIYERKSS